MENVGERRGVSQVTRGNRSTPVNRGPTTEDQTCDRRGSLDYPGARGGTESTPWRISRRWMRLSSASRPIKGCGASWWLPGPHSFHPGRLPHPRPSHCCSPTPPLHIKRPAALNHSAISSPNPSGPVGSRNLHPPLTCIQCCFQTEHLLRRIICVLFSFLFVNIMPEKTLHARVVRAIHS